MPEQKDEMRCPLYVVLGIEGGATKTTWILCKCRSEAESDWEVLQQGQLPAANFKLIARHDLLNLLGLLPKEADRVGVYLPGVLDQDDCQALHQLASSVFPAKTITVGSDRDSGLAAAFGCEPGILVISGTGSSMTGRHGIQIERAGGKGHLVGDKGSAYHLAMEALRLVMDRFDEKEKPCQLAEAILQELGLAQVDDIIDWVQAADKPTIARLAILVFQVYTEGDGELLAILQSGADALAHATAIVAKRLKMTHPSVALQGSMFTKQALYVKLFQESLNSKLPNAEVIICNNSGAVGAARLAMMATMGTTITDEDFNVQTDNGKVQELWNTNLPESHMDRTKAADLLDTGKLIDMLILEHKYIQMAMDDVKENLSKAIMCVTTTLRNGGKLFYVGGGTSQCLQISGTPIAMPNFVEEPLTTIGSSSILCDRNDPITGVLAMSQQGVTSKDVVCGITTPGQTSFVFGALDEAKAIGAITVLISYDAHWTFQSKQKDIHDVHVELNKAPTPAEGFAWLKGDSVVQEALNMILKGTMICLDQSNHSNGI